MPPALVWVLDQLAPYYWKRHRELVPPPQPAGLFPRARHLPPRPRWVDLPEWAADLGVGGRLLVPAEAVAAGRGPTWRRTHWLWACFWFLSGTAEWSWEQSRGAVLSYSRALKGWDPVWWRHAWVNRMARFLRRWAAWRQERAEEELFGALPEARFWLTHDVDAVRKDVTLRLKQVVVALVKAGGHLWRGDRRGLSRSLREALRRGLGPGDYWRFEEIMELERRWGVRSHFFFFAAAGKRGLVARFLDPSYQVAHPALKALLAHLRREGWGVGLHPSFASWRDASRLRAERRHLERALGGTISACRQHWLRFSWGDTWRAQQEAGLSLDATLGFNDRPAFRNGAAIRFQPWDHRRGEPLRLQAMPLLFMDSHFYDRPTSRPEDLGQAMAQWLGEVREVGGEVSLLWHQRVLSPDYGWGEGFRLLLKMLSSA